MNPLLQAYLLLVFAIITEVLGTAFLVKSEGFTRLVPSLCVILLYGCSFYSLSQVTKTLNIGVVYAIWSGVGIIFTVILGYYLFKQVLDTPALIGIGFIVLGVLVMNLFSKTIGH
ncbi:SMR family transporter [Acinetobacter sp.]|uniref:DMT family transporter n=1 Tax=Acinetobacter sp. TaxID=472 RepID=UPI0031DEF0AF